MAALLLIPFGFEQFKAEILLHVRSDKDIMWECVVEGILESFPQFIINQWYVWKVQKIGVGGTMMFSVLTSTLTTFRMCFLMSTAVFRYFLGSRMDPHKSATVAPAP